MPYIKSDDGRRKKLIKGDIAKNAGELNFQIFYYVKYYDWRFFRLNYISTCTELTKQIQKYVKNFLGKKPNYQKYNDITGCLVRCYKEIYRRLHIDLKDLFEYIICCYDDEIAKYEDKKIKENGDV